MLETSDSSFLERHSLHIWKKIGEGSFSKVYAARFGDKENITLVATKVINKNRVSSKFVEKFLPREIDVLIKLRHPFIVQVYSVFQNGYKIYINMEYAENGDIFTCLQTTVLTEQQIRSWLLQILWAFSYMHGVGVVHRDLKCENILVTRNHNLRIADFGFAKFMNSGRNPGVDTVCGTLTYSSPELLSGQPPNNLVCVDVWAIGVVLFMMANNVAPFPNKNREDIRRKQMAKRFVFRSSMNRSGPLKNLTASFLEPDYHLRILLKDALKHQWVSGVYIKTPVDVITANKSIKTSISNPIITNSSLKKPTFYYQLSEYGKSVSTFNYEFKDLEKNGDIEYETLDFPQ